MSRRQLTNLIVAVLFALLSLVILFRVEMTLDRMDRASDSIQKAADTVGDTVRTAKERFIE